MTRKEDKLLIEHNALIMARYDMTATEHNLVSMLLSQLKQDDPTDKFYHIHIKDIEQIIQRKLDYQQMRKAAKKLLSRIYTIKKEGGKVELNVAMISSSEYREGTGTIEIGLSPKVRPYLFGLKKYFTTYGRRMVMTLKSKYAKRLYKMLSQFKSTGVMRISVDELKTRLYLLDPKTGKEKYKDWFLFTHKVLEVSQKELAAYTDIHFTYIAKKTGRKFTQLEFNIKYAPQQLLF